MSKSLTAAQISDIKQKLFEKQSMASLAKEYNVSSRTIGRERDMDGQQQTGLESPIIRKHQVNLSIKDKLDIIAKLEKGQSTDDLAKFYNVDSSTIRNTRSSKSDILKRSLALEQSKQPLDSKRIRTEENIRDTALYSWFEDERAAGTPISGSYLQEKALELHKAKGLEGDFKASNGWLNNFKKRYGIRELSMQEEKLSADSIGAEDFKSEMKNCIVEGGYSLDQMYNADETALYFRSLPRKTLAAGHERQAAGFKEPKERVTVMCCANATGSHKITPLVVGKFAKPRCFTKCKEENILLPVKYTSSKSAWMSKKLFLDWFENVFIQEVKEKHPVHRKVLLLLDNAPSHPSVDELNQIDETIQVKFLPPNVTALVQPMDQGVIEKMKKMYRKKLLKELFLPQRGGSTKGSIHKLAQKQDMKDCCYRVWNSWNDINDRDISHAWNRLFDVADFPREQRVSAEEVNQLLALLRDVPEYADCTFDMAAAWIAADFQENAWERSNVVEIYERMTASSNGSEFLENDWDSTPG
ncbi:jerky protein homolog-like [Phymastichus coffea]|uniref:jerky protein homolog-like n=1 Tax=Phymastichus coffea TaxID=108790 RepID=UPI00273B47A2|nr:jerky protein homolog-like [Phymastichus coffea]